MQNNDNNLIINNNQRTTVKISNIKKSLTSELIYLILEKNFPRAYNAIYTKRKEGHIKNSGVCYINFAEDLVIRFPKGKSCTFKMEADNEILSARLTIYVYYKAI